jgi:hypothetical protein
MKYRDDDTDLNPDTMPTKYNAVNAGVVIVAIVFFIIIARVMMILAGAVG